MAFVSQWMVVKPVLMSVFVCLFSNAAIGSDGLCCQSREVKEWHGCRATRGLLRGTWPAFMSVYKLKLSLWVSHRSFK